MSADSPPREVFGQYLVYEQLGMGGMAEVHRAEVAGIEGFRRVVALKRMLPHVALNKDLVQAFVREARLASHLRHTNVPQTYELGMVDGIYFIAMEYIEGYTLREVLQHCGPTTGPVPVPVALNIINQLCDALDYAHNLTDEIGTPLGIIHRDVSPSNVIVSPGGIVKLIDFGIAKIADTTMQTMSGTIKGKFGYMAPEYIAGHLDARADLFALGVIAHELLTNRPLFTGPDDMATLQRVQVMDIVPPSKLNKHVPKEIDGIVMTALERNPDRRWQVASALRQAMTTLTKRLGLAIPDAQVMTWLQSAFEHTRPQVPIAPQPEYSQSSASMVIEPPSAGRGHTITDHEPTEIALATSHTVTTASQPALLMRDHQPLPSASASATPTIEVAAVAFERHEVQHPTDSMLADDLFPTLVRGSRPSIDQIPRPTGFPPPDRGPDPTDRDPAPAIPSTMRGSAPAMSSIIPPTILSAQQRPPSSLDHTPAPPMARRVPSSPSMPSAPPMRPSRPSDPLPAEMAQAYRPPPQRLAGAPAQRPGEPKLRLGLLLFVMLLVAGVVATVVYFLFSRVL